MITAASYDVRNDHLDSQLQSLFQSPAPADDVSMINQTVEIPAIADGKRYSASLPLPVASTADSPLGDVVEASGALCDRAVDWALQEKERTNPNDTQKTQGKVPTSQTAGIAAKQSSAHRAKSTSPQNGNVA